MHVCIVLMKSTDDINMHYDRDSDTFMPQKHACSHIDTHTHTHTHTRETHKSMIHVAHMYAN
jgi:hypothetical protein